MQGPVTKITSLFTQQSNTDTRVGISPIHCIGMGWKSRASAMQPSQSPWLRIITTALPSIRKHWHGQSSVLWGYAVSDSTEGQVASAAPLSLAACCSHLCVRRSQDSAVPVDVHAAHGSMMLTWLQAPLYSRPPAHITEVWQHKEVGMCG